MKVSVEIEERMMDTYGTTKTVYCERVLRDLGNGGDKYVSYKNTIIPVKKLGDVWFGVHYE